MNAKKAKILRKLLRNLIDQHPEGTDLPEHGFTALPKTVKEIFVEKKNEDGTDGVEKVRLFDGQKMVAAKSQRGVYLRLKKEMEKVTK